MIERNFFELKMNLLVNFKLRKNLTPIYKQDKDIKVLFYRFE